MAHKLTQRPDGNFQKQLIVGRKPDGSYIRKSVYARTQRELEQKTFEIQQKLHEGVYLLDNRTTFADIAKLWLEECNPTQSEKWHQRQKIVIEKHLLPAIGYMKVTELKQFHLQMLINSKAKHGYAMGTMKQIKQTATRILDVAIQSESIVRNVFDKVKVPFVPPKERQALTVDQIKLVNETWETHYMGCPAMIMMYCGLRRGELCALLWKDVDLIRDTITVNKAIEVFTNQSIVKEPKSKAGFRTIPIPKKLHDVLALVKGNDEDLVCPTRHGKLMTETAWACGWRSYMNHLNIYSGGKLSTRGGKRVQVISEFSAHMLRHTYATMLYDAGVDIKSAQYFLGHADLELTLSIYTHLTPFKVDEAIGSLNKHLDNVMDFEVTGDYLDIDDEDE